MASFISRLSLLLVISAAAAVAGSGVSGSFVKRVQTNKLQEKTTHLHFYFHDVVTGPNATAVRVVNPPNPKSSTQFGFLAMIDDLLTVGPEITSPEVGRAQGFYASACQSELGLLQTMNLVFTTGKYNGSVITVLGRNVPMREVREMPVVGGAGLFRFAHGYAQAHTRLLDGKTGYTIVEYNVYVTHY